LVGAILADRYEIVRRIGEGGMGAVYEARHSIIGKRVAIKVLLEKFLESEELMARLLQEARLASSIGHQNIVDVTDFGTTRDGRAFVVMEYLEGESLAQLIIRDAPLPVERSLGIVKQAASALAAAHAKGIVHRDVKPENIYLVRRGEQDFVKVVDFGVSKAVRAREEGDAQWQRLTRTGTVLGTPLFMSPEQAAGSEDVDERADIWAMALILYECLTGELPFRGNNYLGVIAQIQNKEVAPPSALRPELGIPPAVDRVVMRGLEKDRTRRYPQMDRFARDLDRLLAGEIDVGLADEGAGPARPAPSSGRFVLSLGVAGILAAGIGTAALLGRSPRSPKAAEQPVPAAVSAPALPAATMPKVLEPPPPPVEVAMPSEPARRPIRGNQPRATPPAESPVPVTAKKSKADDKIAPSPYTEPQVP
jgi:serine/threonine-protein kinase